MCISIFKLIYIFIYEAREDPVRRSKRTHTHIKYILSYTDAHTHTHNMADSYRKPGYIQEQIFIIILYTPHTCTMSCLWICKCFKGGPRFGGGRWFFSTLSALCIHLPNSIHFLAWWWQNRWWRWWHYIIHTRGVQQEKLLSERPCLTEWRYEGDGDWEKGTGRCQIDCNDGKESTTATTARATTNVTMAYWDI